MTSALDEIRTVSGTKCFDDVPFSALTTLRLGGTPAAVVRCESPDAVVQTIRILDEADVPLLVVGGGSNLVVSDEPGDLVAVVIDADEVSLSTQGQGIESFAAIVEAEAGAEWDDVVQMSVDAGFGGLECLSGIPGSVGATPVQNVGAYGAEVSQTLEEVRLYDRATGTDEWVSPESLDLGYRYSNLKFTSRAVVLAVRFRLTVDGMSAPLRFGELARTLGVSEEEGRSGEARRPVADVRDAVLQLRRGKGMVLDPEDHDTWSAGSFFTNPVIDSADLDSVRAAVEQRCGADEVATMPAYPGADDTVKLSAAWLIERAGFPKGYPDDDAPARLSTKHTLALTNRGSASTADLVALARDVRDGVREAFGVDLVPEPVWIGVEL